VVTPIERLTALPRTGLLGAPTPLQRLDRFGEWLGTEVWCKRDDVGPVALAGNKIRKFDLVLADAIARGCDTLVTTGAAQSNSARAGAAASAALGMRCVLVLSGSPPAAPTANLLLDHLVGADVRFLGDVGWAALDAAAAEIVEEVAAAGGRAAAAPVGCSSPLGSLGFALAFLELDAQLREVGVEPSALVHTSTSGGTHAGLLVGRELAGSRLPIIAVDAGYGHDDGAAALRSLAGRAGQLIGLELSVGDDDVDVRTDQIGDGYGLPTAAGVEAILALARTEAVVTDPIYSAKGLAGLVAMVRRGELGGPVVFWHTGGYHALFDPAVGAAVV
jgi:1-aminocyclopropane-1-carboxylate deaminase/D-cysteine desulfhydrase-like pyridoxal-dependent ACC family enzyme